jgi:hypothetical protein
MVLVIVLIIVVMVSLAGFSFVATMHNEDKATRMRGDELQAEQLMQSGVETVQVRLASKNAAADVAGSGSPETRFHGVLVFDDPVSRQRGRFTVLSPSVDNGQTIRCRYGLENESAKLNLVALLRWEQRQPNAGRDALLRLPGMTDSIADALLDWVDADDAPRPLGAESEFYASLEPSFAPRNGPAECLEELLLVRGVTRQLLYGRDVNRNFQIEPEETAPAGNSLPGITLEEADAGLPWFVLLTVHSSERNVNPQGQPRLNLNDPNLSQLHGQLRQAIGPDLADFAVALRQFGPSQSGSSNVVTSVAIDPHLPASYSLASPLDLVNARVAVPVRDDSPAQVLVSPLSEQNPDYRDRLLQLLDFVTTIPRPVLRGRINVNLAPAPVLQAVPGLDAGLADRIVAARRGQESGSQPERRHPVWLLFERIVDLPRMKTLLPFLTCGGDVFRAQIVGFFDSPGPSCRAEIVFDATQSPPRVLYCKDLRVLGRGHSDQVLGIVSADEQSTSGDPAVVPPPRETGPATMARPPRSPRGSVRSGQLSSDGGQGLD